jgi:hypothetical protein
MKLQEFKVSDQTFKEAKKRFDNFPLINNSIRNREGGLVGYIGEALVLHLEGGAIKDTYDYDVVSSKGVKIDVKTKERKVAPRANYNCTVANFNTKQKCDRYSFVSVLDDYKTAWYLGSISKEDFYKKAIFYKQGDLDPDSSPRYPFKFTADCYNIKVNQLDR